MLSFFKKKQQSDLTAQLASMRLRNEARAKAMRKKMEAEGKHLLNPSFKWIPADKWAEMHGM